MTAESKISRDANTATRGNYTYLTVFIVVCFAVAATGGLFPPGDWYASL